MDGRASGRWKIRLQEFLSASPGLLYLLYAVPPFVFLYDVMRQIRGEKVTVLSGAPLSSWILLGDYLVLGLAALAHSAFTLEDARERRQAFHVFVGTIVGTVPSSSSSSSCPPPSASTSTPSTGSSR